jgi:thiamine-phosphate pyrophosphorylase
MRAEATERMNPLRIDELNRRPLLCHVTDGSAGAGSDNLSAQIERDIAAGIDWIQIRENSLPSRELLQLAHAALKKTQETPGSRTRILINDRLDVAVAAEAAGVHLKESSVPVASVSAWRTKSAISREFLIGASCHSSEAARKAENDGADYLIFGPVFATPSKAAFGPPQGIARLAEIARLVQIPVLAVGGITQQTAPQCIAAGAAGIAAIRMFCDAKDLTGLVAELRASLPAYAPNRAKDASKP